MGVLKGGCLVCGQELIYATEPREARCLYCGREEATNIYCPEGHYICNNCHSKDALKLISDYCLKSKSKNPFVLANELMEHPAVHMHGPEHHFLVPAVLVTAFNNASGSSDSLAIAKAIERGATIPGGYCGNFGACGAGIGTGVAVSILTGATPLRGKSWGLANRMTARALMAIGAKEGPRCCKRCTWTALEEAVKFIEEATGVEMESSDMAGRCTYFELNRQCQKQKCNYYPGKV